MHPSDSEGMGQDLHPRYPNTKMRELGDAGNPVGGRRVEGCAPVFAVSRAAGGNTVNLK